MSVCRSLTGCVCLSSSLSNKYFFLSVGTDIDFGIVVFNRYRHRYHKHNVNTFVNTDSDYYALKITSALS